MKMKIAFLSLLVACSGSLRGGDDSYIEDPVLPAPERVDNSPSFFSIFASAYHEQYVENQARRPPQPQSFGEAFLQSNRGPSASAISACGMKPTASYGCDYQCMNQHWVEVCN